MKETKVKINGDSLKFLNSLKKNYEEDKANIISEYNNKGYRDAKIISDTIYSNSDNTANH